MALSRAQVFARDRERCVYCGSGPPEVELTVDHVEPRMRGGDHSSGNLVTACAGCNRSKGGLPAWAWLRDRDEERRRFLARATYVWPRLRRAVEEAAEKGRGW